MKAKFECIGDVRLIGALLGIELVKNRQTKEKATIEAEKVLYLCLEQGLSFKISQGGSNVDYLFDTTYTAKGTTR